MYIYVTFTYDKNLSRPSSLRNRKQGQCKLRQETSQSCIALTGCSANGCVYIPAHGKASVLGVCACVFRVFRTPDTGANLSNSVECKASIYYLITKFLAPSFIFHMYSLQTVRLIQHTVNKQITFIMLWNCSFVYKNTNPTYISIKGTAIANNPPLINYTVSKYDLICSW